MNIHDEYEFIDWVIDVLRDAGLTVGDARAPETVPTGSGFVVVYSIAGGLTDGPTDAPLENANPNFQVTSSGTSAQQVRWLDRKVRQSLVAAVPAYIGDRRAIEVSFPFASPQGFRDDDVQPPRFSIMDRFSILTVPAEVGVS